MFSIAAAAAARVLCPCPTVVAPAVATAVVVVVVVMVVVCRVGCCCCCAVVSVCSLLTLPRLFTDLSRGIAHLVAVIVVVWCEKLSASSLFALFLSSRSLARFASLRRCRHTVTTTHTQKKSQTEEREGGVQPQLPLHSTNTSIHPRSNTDITPQIVDDQREWWEPKNNNHQRGGGGEDRQVNSQQRWWLCLWHQRSGSQFGAVGEAGVAGRSSGKAVPVVLTEKVCSPRNNQPSQLGVHSQQSPAKLLACTQLRVQCSSQRCTLPAQPHNLGVHHRKFISCTRLCRSSHLFLAAGVFDAITTAVVVVTQSLSLVGWLCCC